MSMFERDDWTLFRSLVGLCQKAGVSPDRLRRLVVKELTDNALDNGGQCEIGTLRGGGYFIEDDGPGIAGTPEDVARLFSIKRPLTSSKLLRLPTRGALGNGLRAVVGAVLTSGGTLRVRNNGQWLLLVPKDDGDTDVQVQSRERSEHGLCVEIALGAGIPADPDALSWAEQAILLAGLGTAYKGKSSAFWYDEDSFFELCQAAGKRPVRELLSELDGLSGGKAGVVAADYLGRDAESLTREECAALLDKARNHCKPVKCSRLGGVGRGLPDWADSGYGKFAGEAEFIPGRGTLKANVPFVVEAWARVGSADAISISVNRTPIAGTVNMPRAKQNAYIFLAGCGLDDDVKVGTAPIELMLNISTPYMPITSDAKEPDFQRFIRQILTAVGKAARSARRKSRTGATGASGDTQKAVILANLDAAINHASGNHKSRFSIHQLFYAVRPFVMKALKVEPSKGWFECVIGEHEAKIGHDIEGMYRDDRGTLYHPHERRLIPLGTLMVEKYKCPKWTFNKVLYIEKQALFDILVDEGWPERHDCALLTSKGQPTRAARDLIDLMGDAQKELLFFCVHDADASGTIIYQSLQNATKARPKRRVQVINLGLEPEEGLAMGLQVEDVDRKHQDPVADYVDEEWAEWLHHHRIELNAMTMPQFVEWLDGKMKPYIGKVVPPPNVLQASLEDTVRDNLKQTLTERILKEGRLDERTDKAFQRLNPAIAGRQSRLSREVRGYLSRHPAESWWEAVRKVALSIVTQKARLYER